MMLGPFYLFDGTGFDALAAGLAVTLLVTLIVVTLRDRDGRRTGLRLVLQVGAVVALLLLAWEPGMLVTPSADDVIVLTPGSEESRVTHLVDSLPNAPVFGYSSVPIPSGLEARVEGIDDAGVVARSTAPDVSIHVVGAGLSPFDVERLQGRRVVFSPGDLPTGIASVFVRQFSVSGAPVDVHGRLVVAAQEADRLPAWLFLTDPGGRADSTRVDAGGDWAFSLRSVPRAEGPSILSLALVGADGDTLAHEEIGIAVLEDKAPSVMIVDAAPSFETRYIREWLGGLGGRVIQRTAISRDRYRSGFVNREPRAVTVLTRALLAELDLLIVDTRSLPKLSGAEARALREAVAGGLGLLLLVEDADGLSRLSAWARPLATFGWDAVDGTEAQTALRIPGETLTSSLPSVPYRLAEDPGVRPLVRTEPEGGVVAALRYHRSGRLGVSLVRETYRWMLEGSETDHAALWSSLVSALARPPAIDRWVVHGSGPVRLHEPLLLSVATEDERPVGVVHGPGGVDTVYLAQDLDEARRWWGRYWPRRSGWHFVSRADSGATGVPFLVADSTSWSVWRQARDAAATAAAESGRSEAADPAERSSRRHRQPFPLVWVFMLFLLCCAGLWLERRV